MKIYRYKVKLSYTLAIYY